MSGDEAGLNWIKHDPSRFQRGGVLWRHKEGELISGMHLAGGVKKLVAAVVLRVDEIASSGLNKNQIFLFDSRSSLIQLEEKSD